MSLNFFSIILPRIPNEQQYLRSSVPPYDFDLMVSWTYWLLQTHLFRRTSLRRDLCTGQSCTSTYQSLRFKSILLCSDGWSEGCDLNLKLLAMSIRHFLISNRWPADAAFMKPWCCPDLRLLACLLNHWALVYSQGVHKGSMCLKRQPHHHPLRMVGAFAALALACERSDGRPEPASWRTSSCRSYMRTPCVVQKKAWEPQTPSSLLLLFLLLRLLLLLVIPVWQEWGSAMSRRHHLARW